VMQLAFSVGARGYVAKSNADSDLLAAVDAVLLGMTFVSKPSATDTFELPT